MPRPKIDLSDEEMDEVEEYAAEHGLRRSRAYADLIRKGLSCETTETTA